jgi:hypothetical protein
VTFARQGGTYAVRAVGGEVLIMDTPEAAASLIDSIAGTARSCINSVVDEANAGLKRKGTLTLAVSPKPVIGEDAVAFSGALTFPGAPVDLGVDLVAGQKGRVVALLLVLDSTGGLSDGARALLVQSMLDRAQRNEVTSVSSS